MRRATYIGKDEINLNYGQTGYLDENDVFIPPKPSENSILNTNTWTWDTIPTSEL